MEIHVIRHTPVDIEKGVCYGQLNVDVAHTFLEDVDIIQGKIDQDYDAVFCSPLDRCQKLAKALNLDNITLDHRIKEFNYGNWEGLKWEAIPPKDLNLWMDDFVHEKTPDGESLIDMYNRIEDFLKMVRSLKHQKILIITHGGVIRCFWASLLEMSLKNLFKIPVGFHELFVFQLGESKAYDMILKKQ